MIMQNIAFAVIMPIYMAIHLSTSPTAARSRGRSPKSSIDFRVHPCDSEAVPYSILLGFVLPTVLMCLRVPTVLTYSQKQNLIAFWQAFPLWISLSHLLLSTLLKNISSISGSASRNPTDRRIVLQALRRVYMFGFASSAVIHVATVSVSLASVLTPGIFATGYRSLFRPFQVFVPISLSSAVQVSSMGEGSMYFLQWDEVVGSTALLVWAATLYRNAHGTQFDWQRWARLVAKVAGLSVIAGPCSAALALVWDRDELIWAQEDAGDKKVR